MIRVTGSKLKNSDNSLTGKTACAQNTSLGWTGWVKVDGDIRFRLRRRISGRTGYCRFVAYRQISNPYFVLKIHFDKKPKNRLFAGQAGNA